MNIRFFRSMSRSSIRGFTLLEMMLVVVIMGVLIGVASVSILGRGKAAKIAASRATMATAASMIKNYNLEQGVYPATLDNLVPKYMEKIPLDAWKRPLVYIPGLIGSGSGSHPFQLYSTGESGESSGGEVIDYWEEDQPNTAH
jgi:general secretion pathway protein G